MLDAGGVDRAVIDLPGRTLAYDPVTGTYSYVWKTNKDRAGTCSVFTLKFDDGSTHSATFQITK